MKYAEAPNGQILQEGIRDGLSLSFLRLQMSTEESCNLCNKLRRYFVITRLLVAPIQMEFFSATQFNFVQLLCVWLVHFERGTDVGVGARKE